MGDWHVLQDFVQWGSTTYPADNLAVVVWDHGSGWEPVPAQYRSVAQNRLFAAPSRWTARRTTRLKPSRFRWRVVAGTAQPIDALIFDASLMQMAEIEYQVRNYRESDDWFGRKPARSRIPV